MSATTPVADVVRVLFNFPAKLLIAADQGLQDAGYRIVGINDSCQLEGLTEFGSKRGIAYEGEPNVMTTNIMTCNYLRKVSKKKLQEMCDFGKEHREIAQIIGQMSAIAREICSLRFILL